MKQKVKNLFQVSLFLLLNINYAYSSGAKLPDIATTSDVESTQLPILKEYIKNLKNSVKFAK